MFRRIAPLTLFYWPPVLLLLVANLLGDCGSSGEPEVQCPMAQTHLSLAVVFAIGIFALGLTTAALKPQGKVMRFGSGWFGLGLVLLFGATYALAGWWSYRG